MTAKKSIALLIALAMAVAMLAGCSSGTPTDSDNSAATGDGSATGEERTPVTFSLLQMASATSTVDPWVDTPVGQYLQDKTNVTLEIEFLVGSDVRQKASLLIAAGEYPDLLTTSDASGDLKAAGAFIPLNDYIANSTNMKNCFTESQLKLMTQEDGNIYWFGNHASENAVYPTAGYYLNMDLLAQAGYPQVTTFEQWQDLIIDYVEKNPTYNGQSTIGVTEPTEAWRASAVQYGGSRFLAGYPNDGLTVIDQDTLEAKVIMNQDFQKEFCLMLNRMWNLGIADPEMFMQTDEQLQSKIGSGRVAGMYDQRSMIQVGLDALEANDPSRMLVAFPVVFDGVETERYRGARTFQPGFGLGISVSCEDPDRAFQFLDDLASEECQTVLRWGIEGTDWSYGEDGGLVKSDEQWAQYNDVYYKQEEGIEQMGWFYFWPGLVAFPESGTIASPSNTTEYAQQAYEDYELEFLSHYDAETFCDWFNPSYDATYEPGYSIRQRIDTSDPRKIAGETALTITLEYVPRLAQCAPEDFDAIWDEFCGKLADLPLAEYEQLVTQMAQDSAPNYQN
ncbi:MAG: extracellular solute-binding protein [Candidatus Spyradocola sp.]|jgi:putative aldouronate transport system substrate-binding protein